jgi:signal transduction histidine kinase
MLRRRLSTLSKVVPSKLLEEEQEKEQEKEKEQPPEIVEMYPHEVENKKIQQYKDEYQEKEKELLSYVRCILHDFKSTFHNISMGMEILKDKMVVDKNTESGKLLHETLENLNTSCDFIRKSLHNVLDISHFNSNKKEVKQMKYESFNIVEIIQEVETLLGNMLKEKNITILYLKCPLTKKLPNVYGNPNDIQHILLNLIGNAIKSL